MQDVVIARYGEIGIKSRAVRNRFESVLTSNISACLNANKLAYERIEKKGGRIYIYTNSTQKISHALKKVFGIVSVSPAIIITTDIDIIKKEALKCYRNRQKKISFRITAKRQTKEFNLNSRQICEIVGAYVQEETGAQVNLSNPGINICVELNGNKTSVFSEQFKGVGGLPIGTQGKVLCMISDMNSIIAALEVLRRGCSIHLFLANSNKALTKKCKKAMKNYYYSKIRLNYSSGTKEKAVETARTNGWFAVVSGESDPKQIKKLQKDDMMLLFPLIGYSKSELKEKIADLK